jgi:hypothetical protein
VRAAAQLEVAAPLGEHEGEMPLEKRAGVNGIAAGSADRSKEHLTLGMKTKWDIDET